MALMSDRTRGAKARGNNWDDLIPSTELRGLDYAQLEFIKVSIRELYTRILWAVVNDVDAKDKKKANIQRTCADDHTVSYKRGRGLISYVAEAMTEKRVIILDKEELEVIRGMKYFRFAVENMGHGFDSIELDPTRLMLDFSKYYPTDLLRMYFALLYAALDGAKKGIDISQALLLKIAELNRITQEDRNVEILQAQLRKLDESVRAGRLGYVDGDSSVEFITYDTDPVEKATKFLYNCIANVTGAPLSWVTGEDSGSSLGDTGEAERKRIRRMKERYFLEIILPLLEDIYQETYTLVIDIENVEQLSAILGAWELDTKIKPEAWQRVIGNMFGFKSGDFMTEAESLKASQQNVTQNDIVTNSIIDNEEGETNA